MKSLLRIAVTALLLSAAAPAQSTPFTQEPFSVTFHGPVLAKTYGNAGEDTTNEYYSRANGIYQGIAVRTISHNIPVTYSSTDFYVMRECDGLPEKNCVRDASVDLAHSYINGHPSSYGFYTFTENGVQYTERMMAVVVDPRTAVRVVQVSRADDASNASKEWLDFKNSLRFLH